MLKNTTAIFTIVAKNYIGLATILGKSITRFHDDIDFYIFVADELSSTNNVEPNVIEVRQLGLYSKKEWTDMAFKYDLTEFCTSVKPACFEYVFSQGYQKGYYFDPDIYAFSPITELIEALDNHEMVLTPQIGFVHVTYAGEHPEWAMNVNGIFNLGFCGIRNSEKGRTIVAWWKQRLKDNAFADRAVGNFTDQKWMDWMPAFLGEKLYVSHSLGTNMAPWNYFEREIIKKEDGHLYVKDRIGDDATRCDRLVFIHFAGYDYTKMKQGIIERKRIENLADYDDLALATEIYRDEIVAEKKTFDRFITEPYTYNSYDNGDTIQSFHRRLYHGFSGIGTNTKLKNNPFENPFSTANGTFHAMISKRGMIVKEQLDKLTQRNLQGIDKKRRMIACLFGFLYRLMGYKRYVLFVKSLYNYCRPEWHGFLIKK